MVKNQIRREDPIMLKQKIIYFQSELTHYKRKVEEYEKHGNIKELKRLLEENARLQDKEAAYEEVIKEKEKLLVENLALKELIGQYNIQKQNQVQTYEQQEAPERKDIENKDALLEAPIKETWFYHNLINEANQVKRNPAPSKGSKGSDDRESEEKD